MSSLLKIVLFVIILYYLYSWFRKSFSPQGNKSKQPQKDVTLYKTKEVEKPKYNIDAETVEYEEIKDHENQ